MVSSYVFLETNIRGLILFLLNIEASTTSETTKMPWQYRLKVLETDEKYSNFI